jgi:hypothetical protein
LLVDSKGNATLEGRERPRRHALGGSQLLLERLPLCSGDSAAVRLLKLGSCRSYTSEGLALG